MQDFDDSIRRAPGVFRYYRFADDIIALTTQPIDELAAVMKSNLAEPMEFNRDKTKNLQLAAKSKSEVLPPPCVFDYLGYSFVARQTKAKPDSRIVDVALSERKIRRLKTRILLAFKSHTASGDWFLLLDRMKFLSSNHRILRGKIAAAKDSPFILAGLYYNYRACGSYKYIKGKFEVEPYNRIELKEIDGYYHAHLARLTKNVVGFGNVITRLKRVSFNRSFDLKIHCDFDPQRISEIKSCWRNV